MRVAILGCGGIGARHAGALAQLGDSVQLVGCVGRDADKTAGFAATHGGAPFTDLDKMIDAVQPDLLIAALPPSVRDGEIEHAASRGVHLLVEKPIALEAAKARRLVQAADTAGIKAAVGFMYRFGTAVQRWQALAAAGETGKVGLFAGSYHCNALHAPWWREQALSGGQTMEQLIHLIDLVRVFMGEPDTVYARSANLFHGDVPGYDAEDVSSIIFGWDDGRIATLNASNIAIPGKWQKEWRLMAQRYNARFDDWNHALLSRTAPEQAEEVVAGSVDPFVAQLADLVAAIRDNRAPVAPLSEGEASLRLALAARRSVVERRELRIADAL
ncbi:MAG: Gfo/Idh/MocA family oxidoreductase [Massilia sp.]|nr:Gfo/Idh/MocA family oxidoreductase [Massilia sp.]